MSNFLEQHSVWCHRFKAKSVLCPDIQHIFAMGEFPSLSSVTWQFLSIQSIIYTVRIYSLLAINSNLLKLSKQFFSVMMRNGNQTASWSSYPRFYLDCPLKLIKNSQGRWSVTFCYITLKTIIFKCY